MTLSVGPVPRDAPVLSFEGIALWVAPESVQLVGPTGRTAASSGGHRENVCPWPRPADQWSAPMPLGRLGTRPKFASEAISHEYDIVYEWGIQSFPASDPPANW